MTLARAEPAAPKTAVAAEAARKVRRSIEFTITRSIWKGNQTALRVPHRSGTPLRPLRLCEILIRKISRKGAKAAKETNGKHQTLQFLPSSGNIKGC
jgi:hypothetical protein